MAFTITGSPIWDLIVVGASGGLLIGIFLFGGIAKALYWGFIQRLYPVKGVITRQAKPGEAKLPPIEDYGSKKLNKKTKELSIYFFRTKASTPTITYSDIVKTDTGKELFFGLQVSPKTILPIEKRLERLVPKIDTTTGSPVLDEKGNPLIESRIVESVEPSWKAESNLAEIEAIDEYVRDKRYKSDSMNKFLQQIANWVGAGIMLICFGVFIVMAMPKIGETVNGLFAGSIDSVGSKCIYAGVSAGMQVSEMIRTGQLNESVVNQTLYRAQLPPDVKSSSAGANIFGIKLPGG